MRKKKYRPYLLLGLLVLGLFYLPKGIVEGVRAISTQMVYSPEIRKSTIEALEAENLLLKNQNEKLRKQLLSEDKINQRIRRVKELIEVNEKNASDFHMRRLEGAKTLLEKTLYSTHGEVVHRNKSHWDSTFWIGLGKGEVSVNSPVLKGEFLVGLVEYVGKHRSRVRLLTDAQLIPSVRVAREHRYLAKGELVGSVGTSWREKNATLKGIGFNYDFSDEEGPARELRSGLPLSKLIKEEEVSLIDVGDLLVTTGMDGVFPKDLPVAKVTEVKTLKEGSVSIEIRAQLCAGNLNDIENVVVLAPLLSLEEEQ